MCVALGLSWYPWYVARGNSGRCRVFCFHRGLTFRFYAEVCKHTRKRISVVRSPSKTRWAGACFRKPPLRQMTATAEDRCDRGASDRPQRIGRGPLRGRTASGGDRFGRPRFAAAHPRRPLRSPRPPHTRCTSTRTHAGRGPFRHRST